MTKAHFALFSHNPDVLTCIANLSNDEVFTPPEFANQLLDTLEATWAKDHKGNLIWSDKSVKFLDPATKSGVFLREIVKRLTDGLSQEFPNLEERIDHILTKQVFGIGVTELTSLLARRSLYCSKLADSRHSIARSFSNSAGNIWYERKEHPWKSGKCQFCGASESEYERGLELETHAYGFIHSDNIQSEIQKMFGEKMRFDVIIGNPPYQINDGGGEGSSAIPLYHHFVKQAKLLDPKYLTMIIPARWYSGGRGLNEFRAEMLNDPQIAEIHDFPETDLVFPGVNIRGGVCYFLRSQSHSGPAKIVNYSKKAEPIVDHRSLLEDGLTSFVRYNDAISILTKVRALKEDTYENRVQSSNPYGMRSNFSDYSTKKTEKANIVLFRSRRGESLDKEVYVEAKYISSNVDFKDKIKVLVSKASPGGDEYPHLILGKPFIGPVNTVSTETYLIVDFPKSMKEAKNLISYMETRFFRFLVSLIKNTQNISRGSFAFVPVQDLSQPWTDELLYKKYKISKIEIAFIESMIKQMGSTDE
jgi:site-specific DNA-methyltransferase (adenine-specific)